MTRRRLVPPPQKATWTDAVRFAYGGAFVVLGIVILVRSVLEGIITFPSIMMGLAFVGFGVYRLYVGVVRYRMHWAKQKALRDNSRG
jgi:hypothetical protein